MSRTAGRYGPKETALAESVASQISGAIAHAHLLNEHRQAEASLRSIFRVAPIGIGVVHNRVLTQVNDRICGMLGYAAEELVGNSARVFYPTDEEFELVGREKYLQIHARGTGSVETRWQRKDGEIIDVLLSSTPLDPSDWAKGVTFTALGTGHVMISLQWWGLARAALVAELEAARPKYDGRWEGLILPPEAWPEVKLARGLLFSESDLPALREKRSVARLSNVTCPGKRPGL